MRTCHVEGHARIAELEYVWPLKKSDDRNEPSRRRAERLSAEWLPCNLGQVIDLSGFGAKIRTSVNPPPAVGDEIQVKFRHALRPLNLAARVVRVTRLGPRSEVAVEFLDVEPGIRAELHGLAKRGAGGSAGAA